MSLVRKVLFATAGALLARASRQLVAAGQLNIYTVNYSLQDFAQRIAGEHARIVFPAPTQADPVFWMPDKQTFSVSCNRIYSI